LSALVSAPWSGIEMVAALWGAVGLGGIIYTVIVTRRLRVRAIDDDKGRRLVRIVRRGSGPVVTWRRAQMVLLSAQGMDAAATDRRA